MGRADYHYRHEPIFYGWKEGDAHTWESDRKQDSVLEFDRPKRSREHPTMKPIALVDYCIRNSSKPRNIVLDPFGGSGTTLLACEATNRDARTIELDPHYADVICARYQKATGNTPIHGTTGQPHNFLPDE
jgi:site-specific DNA-methyltransferase (adenine-specific)